MAGRLERLDLDLDLAALVAQEAAELVQRVAADVGPVRAKLLGPDVVQRRAPGRLPGRVGCAA